MRAIWLFVDERTGPALFDHRLPHGSQSDRSEIVGRSVAEQIAEHRRRRSLTDLLGAGVAGEPFRRESRDQFVDGPPHGLGRTGSPCDNVDQGIAGRQSGKNRRVGPTEFLGIDRPEIDGFAVDVDARPVRRTMNAELGEQRLRTWHSTAFLQFVSQSDWHSSGFLLHFRTSKGNLTRFSNTVSADSENQCPQ